MIDRSQPYDLITISLFIQINRIIAEALNREGQGNEISHPNIRATPPSRSSPVQETLKRIDRLRRVGRRGTLGKLSGVQFAGSISAGFCMALVT